MILIFLPFILFSQNNFEKKSYFNIINNQLKILKLSENEFILYGDKGGVLRTYDGFQTFHQQFSGTHSTILKLDKYQDKVFGITINNEFMISEDKGNLWEIKKLDKNLRNICVFKNVIVITTDSKEILISIDFGKNFELKKIEIDEEIKSMLADENHLFINSTFNSIYIADDLNFDFEKIIVNGSEFLEKKNDKIYLKNISQISEFDENFNKITYKLPANSNWGFFPNDSGFYIITQAPQYKSIKLSYFNKYNKTYEEILTDSLRGIESKYMELIDINEINDEIIVTNLGKTILKSNKTKAKFEIISHLPYLYENDPIKFWDNNNFFISSSIGTIVTTKNGGKTFQVGEDFVLDSLNNKAIKNKIHSIHIFNKDTLIISLFDAILFNSDKIIYAFLSFNSGLNLIPIFDEDFFRIDYFLYEYLDNLYFYKSPDKGLPNINRIEKNKLMKDLYNDEINLEHVFNFKHIGNFDIIVEKENFFGVIETESPDRWNTEILIFRTKLDFSNYEELKRIKLNKVTWNQGFYKYNDSLFFMIVNSKDSTGSIYRKTDHILFNINTKDWKLLNDTILNYISYHHPLTLQDTISLRTNYYSREIEFENYFDFIKLNYNQKENNFDTTFIGHSVNAGRFIRCLNDNFTIIYENIQNIWIPIDEEHLVMNVENAEQGSPAIWTFSPVPNPVKDKCKVKIWTPYMHKISELKIELINIGSGITHHIQNFEINQLDGYHSDIEIDFENQATGAYILNFRLDDGKSMSETIIIE